VWVYKKLIDPVILMKEQKNNYKIVYKELAIIMTNQQNLDI